MESAPLPILWLVAGIATGATIAAIVAQYRHARSQRAHLSQLQRRDGTIEQLKSMGKELTSRLDRQEEQLRELATLRQAHASSATELDQARQTIATLQASLDTVRAGARDVEIRLNAALDAERQEMLERRSAAAAELAAAHDAARTLRAELAGARESSSRAVARLEADLAATRSVLDRSTHELSANAEKQEALRAFVSTLREQYALACAERDAAEREAAVQRERAHEAERGLQEMRDEYARRLDAEHRESVELISRVWDYMHSLHRAPDRPVHEAPAAPPAADREVPNHVVSDVPKSETEYDIERALQEPERQHVAHRGPPPPPPGSTRVRRPVSAMRRDNDVLVICDDGSVWVKRPSGWVEERPVPGSEVERGREGGREE